jgi:peptidoglycan hydrolase-like protein with peptidoglycan-binding domain
MSERESDLPAPDDPEPALDEPSGPETDESEAADAVTGEAATRGGPPQVVEVEDPEAITDEPAPRGPAQICRTIRPGTVGNDVVAVKRALSRAGFMKWGNFTPTWGPNAVRACKAFQAKSGIPQSGDYWSRSHTKLLATPPKDGGGDSAWDAHGLEMLRTFCEFERERQVRSAIVAAAGFWNVHRDEIGYALKRPFPIAKPPAIPPWSDCSGFVTICHHAASSKNPNGAGRLFDGPGSTGTLVDGGRKVQRVEDLKPGDAILYGFTKNPTPPFPVDSPTHVALYVGDEKVITHGKASGPERQHFRYWTEINCMVTYDVV